MKLLKKASSRKTISDILETGVLNKIEGNRKIPAPYEMKFLNKSYIDEVISLENLVVSLLEREDLFIKDSKDFFMEKIFDGKGLLIGVLCEGKLVAYRSVSFPMNSARNFGKDHENIPEDELSRVMHFEATVVHPDFRGNSLQEKMSRYALDFGMAHGMLHVCTTISPYNYPSIKNIMKVGLTVRGIKRIDNEEYEGKLRLLMAMDFRDKPKMLYDDSISIDHRDIEKQKELLRMGYTGYKVQKTDSGFDMVYGK